MDPNFETCLDLLRTADNDENLLVALTMLPRLFVSQSQETVDFVYRAVPWKFIRRLLMTPGQMCEVGLQIWSAFVGVVNLEVERPELMKLITPAATILETNEPMETKILVLQTIISLSACQQGLKYTSSTSALISFKNAFKEDTEKQILELLLINLHSICDYDKSDKINVMLHFILPLAKLCAAKNDTIKFKAIDLAIKVLCFDVNVPGGMLFASCPFFETTLKQLISCKLDQAKRDSLIILCGLLYQRLGYSWIQVSARSESPQISNGQLIALIVHLVCAEIRVILDQTELHIVENTRITNILPICYQTLQEIVKMLVHDAEITLTLDITLLTSVRSALNETFYSVLSFLVERLDLYTLENDWSIIDNSTTLLSLKSFSAWIAEEEQIQNEEMGRLIPLVVTLMDSKCASTEINVWQFITPLLIAFTSEPDLTQLFTDSDGHILVIQEYSSNYSCFDPALKISLTSILLNLVNSKFADSPLAFSALGATLITCCKIIFGNLIF